MEQHFSCTKSVDNSKHTVLIVDDSQAMRMAYRKFMEQADYRIVEAASGEEALTVISQCQPDIVLMDYDMPGMDGITAFRSLQSLQGKANIPTIMVTAADDADVINAAFDAGTIDYIVKPINWVLLKRRLQSLLAARERKSEMKTAEEKHLGIIESSSDISCVYNIAEDRFTFVSPGLTELLGYTSKETPQLSLKDILTPDAYEKTARLVAQRAQIFRDNPTISARFVTDLHLRRKNGTFVWGEFFSTYRYSAKQDVEAAIVTRNIDNSKQVQNELQASEERYCLIAETMSDVIWVYNATTDKFTFMTPSVTMALGYSENEIMSFSLGGSLTPAAFKQAAAMIAEAEHKFRENPQGSIHLVLELQHVHKDGSLIWLESSISYRYNNQSEIELVGVSRNINERKKREDEVRFLSLHDPLTGLLNRNALRGLDVTTGWDCLGVTAQAVVFIDIDNFRVVNDTLGSVAGDQIILNIADRLKTCVATKGLLYRYSGDEFVAIIESDDSNLIDRVIRKIFFALSSQFHAGNRLWFLTASIGVYQGQRSEAIDLQLQKAETAMYVAKKQKNKVVFFDSSMEYIRTREAVLEADMFQAVKNNEFELYYQPVYDIRKDVVNQAEVLMRWNHPEFGRVSPAEFIPLAEKTKLIIPLTEWMISQVCAQLAQWKTVGIDGLAVSVNVSLVSFEHRSRKVPETIINAIRETGIDPSMLKLEITESTLMNDTEDVIKVFQELKNVGVKLALDDFGTGYSSFGYLKNLPLDIVKLDRSLIGALDSDEKEQMIVQAIITILHGLHMEVIAEGVETSEQLALLRHYGCDCIQGFLFSPPLPAEEFAVYYQANQNPKREVSQPSTPIRLEWQKEWSSGNSRIDSEHWNLIAIANELLNLLDGNDPQENTVALLERLVIHCDEHFRYEEQVLAEARYPDWRKHADLHQVLLEKSQRLTETYRNGDIRGLEVFSFLISDVILGHLVQADMRFFSYIPTET